MINKMIKMYNFGNKTKTIKNIYNDRLNSRHMIILYEVPIGKKGHWAQHTSFFGHAYAAYNLLIPLNYYLNTYEIGYLFMLI